MPADLAEQPTLKLGLVCYLDAFYELDTERNHTLSLARIPWSKVVQYAAEYGYDRDEMVFFIRRMDDAHLDKLRAEAKGSGSGGSGEVVHRPPRPD